jgi:histidinol-phosphate aminotransferase
VVVIDEAYQAFSSDTYLNCLSDYPNVILIRTLSKLGLAGLRLGYMVAHSSWIEQFDKVRPPYNINVLTLATTTFLLTHHHDLFVYQAQALIKQRELLFNTLNEPEFKHAGFKPYPSQANFILCKVPNASFYFNALKEQGILIKNTSNQHALLHNTLRFTVSHDAENRALITALKHIFTTY